MGEGIDLYLVGGITPVCEAHLDDWLDEPRWVAAQDDYDAFQKTHGEAMSCHRCRGGQSRDGRRDPLDVDVSGAIGSSWSDGGSVARASGEEIARGFSAYLRHPSVAE